MSNSNNTEQTLQNAQLSNQHGEETALMTVPTSFDVEQYQTLLESTLNLEKKKRTVSIVPKYYEFTTSLEDVQKAAEKKKGEEKEKFLEMSIPQTKCKGIFQGITVEPVTRIDEETGEEISQTRKIVKWITPEGLFINFGAQLIRAVEYLPIGTPIEIQYIRKEPVQSIQGANVKIYEVYPLI